MAASIFDVHSLSFNGSVRSVEEETSELLRAKIGVKEVVDAGLTQVPDIFIFPKEQKEKGPTHVRDDCHLEVPVIDLQGLQSERRSEIVTQIRKASEKWGIFQLVNHGIPQDIIQSLLESLKKFNEQPKEQKAELYSTEVFGKKVGHRLAAHPVYKVGLWKDSLVCNYGDLSTQEIEALPSVFRKPMSDHVKSMTALKDTLTELLSEALGLRSDHLKMMRCMETPKVVSHYSPACPEPSLVMATREHTDSEFLTFLVQNQINGLQVLYEDQWIDVNVKKGAIIVNIGDMLQVITNGVFKSVRHRAVARPIGPRVSCACFFNPADKDQAYGPIKELLEGSNAPVYKEISSSEQYKNFTKAREVGEEPLSYLVVRQ